MNKINLIEHDDEYEAYIIGVNGVGKGPNVDAVIENLFGKIRRQSYTEKQDSNQTTYTDEKQVNIKEKIDKLEQLFNDREVVETLFAFLINMHDDGYYINIHDFRRWCLFVFKIYENNIEVNIEEFKKILVEDFYCTYESAFHLANHLEIHVALLQMYNDDESVIFRGYTIK